MPPNTHLLCPQSIHSPSKGEELNNFPPFQGEGQGGGGVNEMSMFVSIIRVEKNL